MDLQDWFNNFVPMAALNLLNKKTDLCPEQVELLRSGHHQNQLDPLLRGYVEHYPTSRYRALRGRPRKLMTDASDRDEMDLVASFWRYRLEPIEANGQRGFASPETAARQLIASHNLHADPPAVLNRISALRYHVDMRDFWVFVVKKYGYLVAAEMYDLIRPNRTALRSRLIRKGALIVNDWCKKPLHVNLVSL